MKLVREVTQEDYRKVMEDLVLDFYNQRSDRVFPTYLEPEGGTQFVYINPFQGLSTVPYIAIITNDELSALLKFEGDKKDNTKKAQKVFDRLKKILDVAGHVEGGFCERLIELACKEILISDEVEEAIKQCSECEYESCLFENFLKQKGLYEKFNLTANLPYNTGGMWQL
jgi:hypothetical protein